MPSLNITANELPGSGTGVPTGTGAAFIAVASDAGPPLSGPIYVACRSMSDYINAFGPRTSTSAIGYDWADEFFRDAPNVGSVAYVVRVTDQTATSAALTLNDATPHPSVVVTAATPGLEGNLTYVTVTAGTGSTFTASTTSSSTSITSVSSFKSIGVGTPVTGTGIPANTYIASINTGANTAVLSNPATATGSNVTLTPGNVTITVAPQDASGSPITTETHGPYYTTAQLFADTSSAWVAFTQSAGTGFTQNLPAASAAAPLTGGADANDLTDASFVSALVNFPKSLGPGTVCLPGKTSTTAWNGLDAHAAVNGRFAVKDMADSSSATAVAAAAQAQASSTGYVAANASYGMFIQGSVLLPGTSAAPTVQRTAPGSSAVAALRAQVAAGANQNRAPAGKNWPLRYPSGFTTFHGPIPVGSTVAGCFTASDVATLEAAGVNCFANFQGALCLFGFVTPVPKSQDSTYWQASASVERMSLMYDAATAMGGYLFDPITSPTITQMHGDLEAIGQAHEAAGALFDLDGGGAFSVDTTTVNTATTAAAGQLNATFYARLTPYADAVNITITVVAVTQQVPQEVTA